MNVKIVLVFVILVLLAFGAFSVINAPALGLEQQHISNVFIDVNGDGMVDLLLSGDVVLNNGTVNFPFQPTNSQP